MVTRADKFTFTNKKQIYYTDFLNDFSLNPVTGELARLTNVEAIKQSIMNLVKTKKNERFYDPNKGSAVYSSLFDLANEFTEHDVQSSVMEVLQYEPRAKVENIHVESRPDINELRIVLEFSVINIPNDIFTLDFTVERVR